MRTIRTKVYQFSELSTKAKLKAIAGLNAEYRDLMQRYHYAKEFTPHKVAYYDEQITKIVTRKDTMPEGYEFKEDGTRF